VGGEPIIAGLNVAVKEGENSAVQRRQRYAYNHDDVALKYMVPENARLNRYLEQNYDNLRIYRTSVLGKLAENPTNRDPLAVLGTHSHYNGHLVLSDFAPNLLGEAKAILEDLQDLSSRLTKHATTK
jgi:hypothetical protein